jgi:biotin carboxylase
VHILLVNQGDRASKRFIPRRLAAAGHRLDLLHWSPAAWDREHFGRVMAVRFADWAGLAAAAGRAHDADPFDGVLCYDEATVPIANDLARLLGRPAVSTHWGDAFRYKDRMRVAWEAAGLRVPRYRVLHRKTDLRPLATWQFPVVLKPAAMMGSRGVVRVDSFADLAHCWHLPFDADEDMRIGDELWSMAELFDIPQTALAEEYIAGPEFSAEGVVVDGAYHLIGVTAKTSGGAPYFDEIGHVFPAASLAPPAERQLRSVLETAHRALGLCNGVTHTEFRVDDEGVCLMELNARIPGGHITELVELVTGIDLVAVAARVACGTLSPGDLASPPAAARPACAAAVHLTAPPHCLGARFGAATVPEPHPARLLATYLHVQAGDLIPVPRLTGETRLGSVILTADDPASLVRGIARVRAESEITCSRDACPSVSPRALTPPLGG